MHHIKMIYICMLYYIKEYSRQHSMVTLGDSFYCLYVSKGVAHEFNGLIVPSSSLPSWQGELVGVVSCCRMFFLGRYMIYMKGFVWKWGKPKGLWWRVAHYMSHYIKQIEYTLGRVVWDDHWDEDKREC